MCVKTRYTYTCVRNKDTRTIPTKANQKLNTKVVSSGTYWKRRVQCACCCQLIIANKHTLWDRMQLCSTKCSIHLTYIFFRSNRSHIGRPSIEKSKDVSKDVTINVWGASQNLHFFIFFYDYFLCSVRGKHAKCTPQQQFIKRRVQTAHVYFITATDACACQN